MLVGLEKTTLVNFPGKVASAIFLPGCNMRCGFCHNAELAISDVVGESLADSKNTYYTLDEIFNFLKSRKNIISGVVITGGEPFASPYLYKVLEKVKEMNLLLKVDTNGLFPKKLKELLCDKFLCPNILAIDIKTSPKRYLELMGNNVKECEKPTQKILESLDILRYFKGKEDFLVEYRTVLVPKLVGEQEIVDIAKLLPQDATWNFAEFVTGSCLNPLWNFISTYTKDEINNLVDIAKSFCKNANLR